jgi:rhodanese-related sulfurtransferase
MDELGQRKVEAAKSALQQMNPDVLIDAVAERLSPSNVAELMKSVDLAVDAADSFAVTYTLSDECHRVSKPLVSASVLGLSGYLGSFCGGAPSYRAIFPEMPRQAGSCAASGVLGTAVGVMGTLQAHSVLALVLGWEPSPLGRLITIDFRTLRTGGFSFRSAREPDRPLLQFIGPGQVSSEDIVVDLRGITEAPMSPFASALRISADDIEHRPDRFPLESRVVLCCRTGVRAWRAARVLQQRGHRHLALIAFGD